MSDITISSLLRSVRSKRNTGATIMARKAASRGVDNLVRQGAGGIIHRMLEDKGQRVRKLAALLSGEQALAKIGSHGARTAMDILRAEIAELLQESDGALDDLLDIANYALIAAALLDGIDTEPKVYIACGLNHASTASSVMREFRIAGFEVTYDWTEHNKVKGWDRLRTVASLEANGVAQADVLVALASMGGRGTHTEIGMALAHGIPVVLIGEYDPTDSCSFYALCEHVATTTDAISRVKALTGKE